MHADLAVLIKRKLDFTSTDYDVQDVRTMADFHNAMEPEARALLQEYPKSIRPIVRIHVYIKAVSGNGRKPIRVRVATLYGDRRGYVRG